MEAMSLRASLSSSSSLSALLVSALLAGCGGNVVVTGGDGGQGGTPTTTDDCAPGLTKCGALCVSTASDPQNCGKCFNSCQGGACQGGVCDDVPACPSGLTSCSGQCVNTETDPAHCGTCSFQCQPGTSCSGGDCAPQCLCGFICDYWDLGSKVPQGITVGLATADFAFQVVCGPPGNWPEVSFLFTAPHKGAFSFDTFGSEDTALQVLSPQCTPHACNDDFAPNGASKVTLELGGGQKVLIVVDVLDGASTVSLNIEEDPPCATCGEYLNGDSSEEPLCFGSDSLYNEVVSCICEGACAMACAGLCAAGEYSPECEQCAFDKQNGCGFQVADCASDV